MPATMGELLLTPSISRFVIILTAIVLQCAYHLTTFMYSGICLVLESYYYTHTRLFILSSSFT